MRTSKRVVLIFIGALVLLGGAWVGYWHWSANTFEQAVNDWTKVQRERGYQIAYRGPEIGGFPVELKARFESGQIAALEQGWRWSGPTLSGESKLWTPLTIALHAPGRHEIERVVGGEVVEGALDAESADGLVELRTDGTVERARLDLSGLTWRDNLIGALTAERAKVALGPLTYGGAGTPADVPFVAELTAFSLPEGMKAPLGRRVQFLHLDGLLRSLPPPGPLRPSLVAWRDSGGVLEVERVVLHWAGLKLSGSGTLSLDGQMRPLGAFTAEIQGLREALGVLVENGTLEPGQALAVELGAGLVSERDAEGNLVARLPITLQNGQAYLGPVALFPLSPVL